MRLLVVEDHPIFRDGLLAALKTSEDLVVVSVAETVAEARKALRATPPPDVALVDLGLPDGSGIEVIAAASASGTRVLVLTMSHDAEDLVRAVRAGARGYVVKGSDRADILSAIHRVAQGDAVFGSNVAELVLDAVGGQDARAAAFPTLSVRELDILDLLAVGLPNGSIATRMHLSEKTVRNYVSSILGKLGVASRHEAAELMRARS